MSARNPLFKVLTIVIAASMLIQLAALPARARSAVPAPSAAPSSTSLAHVETVGLAGLPVAGPALPKSIQPLATTLAAQPAPDSLDHPISVSRVQSTYQAGGTAVISFTVTNHNRVVQFPDIPDGANVTDTAQILETYDLAQDPNTIHDVVLSTAFSSATFLASSEAANQQGNTLVWSLGDLPPQGSTVLTANVQLPGNSTGTFTDLDSGARAYGTLHGRLVQAQAAPARLAPDGFGHFLVRTPDADYFDEHALRAAALLQQDPDALFELVRDFAYEAYTGSLRGTRGTLWSEAGNSADQASLLIAMLRAAGIPGRYRHGTLPQGDAQTLIASMFPDPTRVRGNVPAGSQTADPVNDPALIAKVQDHWWVEAYLPGPGWQNMDPSFSSATVGAPEFATPDGSDRSPELPDSSRHKVNLALKIETYREFPVGGPQLQTSTPLAATFDTVSLAGEPVSLLFRVDTEQQGGMVYANAFHTYSPLFQVGIDGVAVEGESFQEFLTNYPLASIMLTGVWLTVERRHPDGTTTTYERELKDAIGPAQRQALGDVTLEPRGFEPFLSQGDVAQVQVLPHSAVPEAQVERLRADLLAISSDLAQAYADWQALEAGDAVQDAEFLSEHLGSFHTSQVLSLNNLGTEFHYLASHPVLAVNTESLFVRSYPEQPKLVLLSQSTVSDTTEISFELLNIEERALPYPGQAVEAAVSATTLRTLSEKDIEVRIMALHGGSTNRSPFVTFADAADNGVPMALITSQSLAELEALPISSEAKGRISQAIAQGLEVVVPTEMVAGPDGPTIAWMEVDAAGNVSLVGEDGRRASATEYESTISLAKLWSGQAGMIGGFMTTMILFLSGLVVPDEFTAILNSAGKGGQVVGAAAALGGAVTGAQNACFKAPPTGQVECRLGVLAASTWILVMLADFFSSNDPSLPPVWFEAARSQEPDPRDSATVSVSASTGDSSLSITADTTNTTLIGNQDSTWSDSHSHGLNVDSLEATGVDLYDGPTLLESGTLSLEAPARAILTGGPAGFELQANGSTSAYAPATSGLALGSTWTSYSSTVTSTVPFTLTLFEAEVTADGSPYSGTLTAATAGPADLSGSGYGPLPQFAPAATFHLDNTNLSLGPLAGTVTAGGVPFLSANGLAVAGFSGSVSVTDNGASDLVQLSGLAQFFSLELNPPTSGITPGATADTQAIIPANFSGNFQIYVEAPPGWATGINSTGAITATAPASAQPGVHKLLVFALSAQHPDLIVSAIHEITVLDANSVALSIEPEPLLTIPMGPVLDASPDLGDTAGHVPDGQAEVPESAYTIVVENRSTSAHTYNISVSGLPAGWTLLGNAGQTESTTLSLAAGETGEVGLYVSPGTTLPFQPTSYTINVSAVAQDNGLLDAEDFVLWTMPGVAFPYPTLSPGVVTAAAGQTAEFDFQLTNVGNVGNVAGSFPVTLTMRSTPYSAVPLQPSLITSAQSWNTGSLAPGASNNQTVVLTTTGTTMGQVYYLVAETAEGEYHPTAYAALIIASPNSAAVYDALACSVEPSLEGSFEALGNALLDLDLSCEGGGCNSGDRTQAANAADALVSQANLNAPTVDTSDVSAASTTLAGATEDGVIGTAASNLSAAVAGLGEAICETAQHQPSVNWTPVYDAGLVGQAVTYTLEIENQGSLVTTYALTVELPSGQSTFDQALNPGQTAAFEYPVNPGATGMLGLQATATATGTNVTLAGISDSADATLNVVERFVQLTAVTPDPAFVETGASSTTLSIDVTNSANLQLEATARTRILAPGGAVSYTADLPLTLQRGDPRSYVLGTVDTSGWAEDAYTITVELLDGSLALIPDGSGYGFLGVGQALGIQHALNSSLAAPGAYTVTTVITTEVLADTILPDAGLPPLDAWQATGLRQVANEPLDNAVKAASEDSASSSAETTETTAEFSGVSIGLATTQAGLDSIVAATGVYTRTEQDEAAITYSGTWAGYEKNLASSGSYTSSQVAGDTASFGFYGNWINVGFFARETSGEAEITIDGISQGTIDLYRHDNTPLSYVYDNLGLGSHTITVTVLGTMNPSAQGTYVQLDYFDVLSGTVLPDGNYEEDSDRILKSTGWSSVGPGIASGSYYLRSNQNSDAAAWFPFSGTSFTYKSIAWSGGGEAQLHVDGEYLATLNLFSFDTVTRTFSFTGFVDAPHVAQVSTYRARSTVDAFASPGSAPFYAAPVLTGVVRYEEDDPAIRYNGLPYTTTATTWNMHASAWASDGFYARSTTLSDTVSLDFAGSWIGVGFIAEKWSGKAEVFIDGESQGVLDLYRRAPSPVSFYYDGLVGPSHTISVTALGVSNDLASGTRMNLDFFDTWDGNVMADGTFEAEDGYDSGSRVHLTSSWTDQAEPTASGGTYLRQDGLYQRNAWFPFVGSSVTFHGFANPNSQEMRLYVDGQFVDDLNIHSLDLVTRTISLQDLGNGPHVLQVQSYRDIARVDAFTTPGSAPYYSAAAPSGLVHYEEDHPALRYNGLPITATATSWGFQSKVEMSEGYGAFSRIMSDTVSLDFEGTWAAIGFWAGTGGGLAEVSADGASLEVVDTYSPTVDVLERFYTFPDAGPHTITVTVLGVNSGGSSTEWVRVDYVDFWDGTDMADGSYEADPTFTGNDRVDLSGSWSSSESPVAGDKLYYEDGKNVWFRFTGDAATVLAMTDKNAASEAEIFVDGVSQGTADLTYDFSATPWPLHYSGLGAGPHVIRFKNTDFAAIDAFEANPTSLHPGLPMVEWYDAAPGTGDGVIATAAAGDLGLDGDVEIAISSDNGNLYLYHGDGGGSSPLIWSGAVGNEPDAPVFADLDGAPGAEVVIGSRSGIYAFEWDGTQLMQLWFTDTVKPAKPAGGAAVGNLDLDSLPEIVVAAPGEIAVLEPDGSLAWQFTDPTGQPAPPVLADLNGDGYLDILAVDIGGDKIHLIDYNLGSSPVVLWTYVLTSSLNDLRGSPAVADIDGLQPGGDDGPEIIIASSGYVTVLEPNGEKLWDAAIGTGKPGGISIADTDGDGEVEIITAIQHLGGRIYVLNADGSLLWEAEALDNTSGTAVSTHDFDGDGSWEVVWNGDNGANDMGLTIYRGTDGAILFNEPLITSITRQDYPIVADVDGDGYAEIVAGDYDGVYVVGWDGVWAASRPLWNQYNYHVTNINDDLTVPSAEPDSWAIHNTYRTQTPMSNPAPAYSVLLTHTAAISDVAVLTNTFNISPALEADPVYGWDYGQEWYEPVLTRTFDSRLENLQPGEARLVAQGTEMAYTLSSGTNYAALPPLYVSVPHIVAIAPPSATVGVGDAFVYDVALYNPGASGDTYSLSVAGLPVGWTDHAPAVALGAGITATIPLTVSAPADAATAVGPIPADLDFVVVVSNTSGGVDQASAALRVIDGIDLHIGPTQQSAELGDVVSYTLTISNNEGVARAYDLSVTGLAGVSLPPTVTVPANSPLILNFDTWGTAEGPNPFTIHASGSGGSDGFGALLDVSGGWDVGVSLDPVAGNGGPGVPTVYTVTVTNLGLYSDTYDLDVGLPGGWGHSLSLNGQAVTGTSLPPQAFNSASLRLIVTPDQGAVQTVYPISVTAQSAAHAAAIDTASGTLTVGPYSVVVTIEPASQALDPRATGNWNVSIKNTGSQQDTYDLAASGFLGAVAQFSQNPVTVSPGPPVVVQMTANNLDYLLPGTYPLGVTATSQNAPHIQGEDQAEVTLSAYEGVEFEWLPGPQTVIGTLEASFVMVVTNTGNVATAYQLSVAKPGLRGQLPLSTLLLQPRTSILLPLEVAARARGEYALNGSATSSGASDSQGTTLTVIFDNIAPEANAGEPLTVTAGALAQLDGSGSTDPDNDLPLSYRWQQEGGVAVTLSSRSEVSPTFVAPTSTGPLTFSLVVTDSQGLADPTPDQVVLSITNTAPIADAGPDATYPASATITLDGSGSSDPEGHLPLSFGWVQTGGPQVTISGTQQVSATFDAPATGGVLTFSLAVTDNLGLAGPTPDSVVVTVSLEANLPPVANAGPNRTVATGSEVTLNGSGSSDPDNHQPLSYGWAQSGGETLALTVTDAVTLTFVAPSTAGTLTLTLSVTDSSGLADITPDTVVITVTEEGPVYRYSYLPIISKP